MYDCTMMFFSLLGTYLEGGDLSQVQLLAFAFKGLSIFIFVLVLLVYIPSNNVGRFIFTETWPAFVNI